MASSDARTSSRAQYQVFLSFRGPDTRTGFTDFLYHSLIDAGICVFRDDEELRVGERIETPLLQAIHRSKIYILILSQTYALSNWCLRELEQIVANTTKSKGNKEILPIFFDVEPDYVKLKTPLYRDALQKLKSHKLFSNEQVDAWREALKEVGAIKGWEVKKFKGHGELIKLVIEEVVEKLKRKHRLVTEHLVGIDDRVEAVVKLLDINSGGVRFINIYGMGGIGKTTLVKVVFNQVSSHFGKCCCFLEHVRAKSSRIDGLVDLQKKLLSEIAVHAGTSSIDEIDYGMERIGEALSNKKVLIVLDDVHNSEQVEKLVGKNSLHSGSRILITTRNKDVLRIHRRKYQIFDYEMEVMSTDCALELFSRHAFNSDSPSDGYHNLSRCIVFATGRLPLALEVIGSFLYEKGQQIWLEALEKLRTGLHEDVFGKLKISYDALSFEQQQIFLDIACLFIGMDKTNAIYMWKDHEYSADTGVDVLINMSLVKIVENNKFWMHDQLRDLGREIVRQENPMNPRKRSRLWINEEILDTRNTKEMNNVQALGLNLCYTYLDLILSEKIGRFEHQMHLKLNGRTFNGNLANSLTNLSWIFWSQPPPMFFKRTNVHLKNVVFLNISHNDLMDDSTLQSVIKMAGKLKVLSLESCHSLIGRLDFSGCPNLERLTFEQCFNLRKIDSSIGKLKCLIYLRIFNCFGLEDLPEEIGDLMNLQHFSVQQCKVKKPPSSIWKLKLLREVHFESRFDDLDSANSWELPNTIGMLRKLEVLLVNNEYLRGQLPSEIGHLPFLRVLDLSYTHVSGVPKTINKLPRLQRLKLRECNKMQELSVLPTSLTHLLASSELLQAVPDLSNLTNLVELDLNGMKDGGDELCTEFLWWIGGLPKLTKSRFRRHNIPDPANLASLPLLNQLYFYGLDLQTFPELPLSLQKLRLDNFNSILSLSPNLINLSYLEFFGSPMQEFQLDGLQLPDLRELHVVSCAPLEKFRLSRMRKLKVVDTLDCPKLVEIQFPWVFESLEALSIQQCQSFERLVYFMGAGNVRVPAYLYGWERTLLLPSRHSKLQRFVLGGCPGIFKIAIRYTWESLEYFTLFRCPNVQYLRGLSNLKNLKYLRIFGNDRLQNVDGLHVLKFLDKLEDFECGSLTTFGDVLFKNHVSSQGKLPSDCHIDISVCGKDFRGSLNSYKQHKDALLEQNSPVQQFKSAWCLIGGVVVFVCIV